MEKKRWVLILMALCLAFVFSVSSVEAEDICDQLQFCDRDMDTYFKDHKRCAECTDFPTRIDCSDSEFLINPGVSEICGDGIDNNCNDAVDEGCNGDPEPPAGPRIATVRNSSGAGSGGAALYITEQVLHGTYTKVKVKDFNNWDAQTLRNKVDVVHVVYQSSPSIDASWPKLRDFMNAEPDPCGNSGQPICTGGSILFEDPSNNLFDIQGLNLDLVEQHVPGDDPAILWFEPESSTAPPYDEPGEILSAFTAVTDPLTNNETGYFLPGITDDEVDVDQCALDEVGIGTTFGLGYGCSVNNHITFMQDPGLGLVPFIRLLVDSENLDSDHDPIVAVYGIGQRHEDASQWLNGRILITGPDHGFHADGGPGVFQDNHFCLLTNELIWLSQAYLDPVDIEAARDDCVTNSQARRDLIGE